MITALILLALVMIALALPRIPQDPNYHHFAAEHTFLGIPNFWNVVSNAAFLFVGGIGLLSKNRKREAMSLVFCLGVFLTGFGSAYYHWTPTNQTLFWDRLPMTIAFSGVMAALLQNRINKSLGRLLWPLLIINAATVIYWSWTESRGSGNLVPYGIVQFGTVALLLGVLLFAPRRDTTQRWLWMALAAYIAAKLLEGFDKEVATAITVMGGHPIKHVAAALGCWCLFKGLFENHQAPVKSH